MVINKITDQCLKKQNKLLNFQNFDWKTEKSCEYLSVLQKKMKIANTRVFYNTKKNSEYNRVFTKHWI